MGRDRGIHWPALRRGRARGEGCVGPPIGGPPQSEVSTQLSSEYLQETCAGSWASLAQSQGPPTNDARIGAGRPTHPEIVGSWNGGDRNQKDSEPGEGNHVHGEYFHSALSEARHSMGGKAVAMVDWWILPGSCMGAV